MADPILNNSWQQCQVESVGIYQRSRSTSGLKQDPLGKSAPVETLKVAIIDQRKGWGFATKVYLVHQDQVETVCPADRCFPQR